jgi:hypothetical protein
VNSYSKFSKNKLNDMCVCEEFNGVVIKHGQNTMTSFSNRGSLSPNSYKEIIDQVLGNNLGNRNTYDKARFIQDRKNIKMADVIFKDPDLAHLVENMARYTRPEYRMTQLKKIQKSFGSKVSFIF